MSKILPELFVGNIYQANSLFGPCMDHTLAFNGLDSTEASYPVIKAVVTVCFDQTIWCNFRRGATKSDCTSEDCDPECPVLPQELLKYKNNSYLNLHFDKVSARKEGESQHTLHSIILADDSNDEGLFNAFGFVYDLVEYVREQNGSVFIHCTAGMSRSVTLTTSYLIKKWNKGFNQVYRYVSSIHPKAAISNGFAYQLRLYKRYRCTVDQGFANYYFNTYSFDEDYLMMEDEPERQDDESKLVYSCKACREVLFFDINTVPHDKDKNSSEECSSVFIEPMDWMPGLEAQDGRLSCKNTKCNSKLGYYSWHGRRCSCGHLQVPAFQIQSSKVDVFFMDPKIHRNGPVRNVHLT
ncbi:dual-specificity protein phosphatase, putative [Theileria equi strain WA]|uniref:protein-tyrosine-phosphatase n=1 Tax=Theileria equi strain WA TaxID=1537102 RepID=L0AW53_THEEQ|nr:dual-specificity protein phosphatase, putative [Theileria equi strain WA]AFZ79261.1 dual-specificity protein phosphatase, putative [Theileria equi strain WA]|eukprot:XP_004828927.1 dual-specificity protein phosphatase, putative [Theileria equi strain WA]